MAIQYPDFRADPNAVPNAGGWEGIINSAQKGYILSQLPAQMRTQRDLQAAQLQKTQQENEWFPKNQQAAYDQALASTEYSKTQNRLAPITAQASANAANANAAYSNEQTKDAQIERQRAQAFYNMLTNGGNAQPGGAPAPQANLGGPAPIYQPGNSGAPLASPAPNSGGSPQFAPTNGPQTMPAPVVGAPGQDIAQQGKITNPGNPKKYYLDNLFDSHPEYEDYFNKLDMKKTVKNEVNPKTGQLMTITTYPSGKQISSSAQVGPGIENQAFEKQMGTDRATAYKDYTKSLGETVKLQTDIDSIQSQLMSPDFMNSVGPATTGINKLMGSGASAKLMGDLGVSTASMQAQVAATMGSQAPKSRIQFAASLKPAITDRPDVFVGKLEAVNRTNQWLKDYNAYISKQLLDGKTEQEAILGAEKAIPWDKYKKNMDSAVKTGELTSQLRDRGAKLQYADNTPWVEVPSLDDPTKKTFIQVSDYNDYLKDYNTHYGNNGGKK